jgi:peptide-methionine (S)-S-oxide reductase
MNIETAVFGGGCFWCTEAVFKMLKGVSAVMPGYAGGATENPTYESVSDGNTGHAEVIEVKFDPSIVSYEDLLTVFFGSHDPSTKNRQGADVGTQYRSIILYTSEAQKEAALKTIADINASNTKGDPVVTEVAPLTKFYGAEEYHIDYFNRNKKAGYCQLVINPKLEKMQQKFYKLLA